MIDNALDFIWEADGLYLSSEFDCGGMITIMVGKSCTHLDRESCEEVLEHLTKLLVANSKITYH